MPSEPTFVKLARQSPYADPKWLQGMRHSVSVDKEKNQNRAKDQEATLEALQSEQESHDRVRGRKYILRRWL